MYRARNSIRENQFRGLIGLRLERRRYTASCAAKSSMSIRYDKLFALLKEKGYSTYRIRQEKLIGQGTLILALMNDAENKTGQQSATIAFWCGDFLKFSVEMLDSVG